MLSAWVIGTFFDAFRNGIIEYLIEHLFKKAEINWDFFFRGKREKVAQLEEYFYAYYQLDTNMAIATFFFFICSALLHYCWCMPLPTWREWLMLIACSLVVSVIFARDAYDLRKEIKRLIDEYEFTS